MGKFLRLLSQLWLLIAFGVLTAASTYYVQTGQIAVSEQTTEITFALPWFQQVFTVGLWQYTLGMLVIGAALTSLHFGLDSMRKTMTIRRLRKDANQRQPQPTSWGQPALRTNNPPSSTDEVTIEN